MLELGDFSKELHKQVGKEVVKNDVDILITVGKEAINIAETAKKDGMKESNIYVCNSIIEAEQVIKKVQKAGDIILLKASNSMHFNELAKKLL